MCEYGYLRQDYSGRWLLIPEDEIGEHDALELAIFGSEWMSTEWCALISKYKALYVDEYLVNDIDELLVLLE